MSFFGPDLRNAVAIGVGATVPVGTAQIFNPASSLDLNFLTGTLDPRITFTRTTTATYFDSTGTLQSAAINEARFDYNPSTLATRGLLIEEARTNSIRNNTMVGAVAGTPGTLPTNWTSSTISGLTREIVGTGTENGITYIDIRYTGTPSALTAQSVQPESNTGVAALQNQTWTGSAWVAIVGGTLTNITSVAIGWAERNSGGTSLASGLGTTFTPTATLTRQTYTRTLTNALTAFYNVNVRFTPVDTVTAIDITLRIGLPQLELGAFATSVIPTSTVAVQRTADVASMTGTNFSSWYNATEGTIYVQGITNRPYSAAVGGQMVQISDGTASNRIWIAQANTTSNVSTNTNVSTSGSTVVDISYGVAFSANLLNKSAFAYANNNFAGCTNASTVQTDLLGGVPTVTTLYVGISATLSAASNWNGWISRIAYYPRRLENLQLQILTR